jgi:hypothetical protein
MSKDKDFRHGVSFTDAGKKKFERIAALCELESWNSAIDFSAKLALLYAEAYVKGDTMVHFCTPKLANVLINNPEFFAALCEEGVVEWLTPFVLAKPKQSNHPAPDTTQP